MDEVYFCGSCNRQQGTHEGERCKVCRRLTVSWYPGRESADVAMRRWKHING
jgi:hypothetical protein